MPARPPTIAALLKDLGADDLREVVAELCKLSPQNRVFVDLFLRGSDEVDTGAILDTLSAKLRACFLTRGDRPRRRPDLSEARRLVVEHERVAADHPAIAAEGALLYVEAAADYAAAVHARSGFVQTATADAATRMFERFVRAALARPSLAERLLPRAEGLHGLDRRFGRFLVALRSGDASDLDARAAADDGYRIDYIHDGRPSRGDDAWDDA